MKKLRIIIFVIIINMSLYALFNISKSIETLHYFPANDKITFSIAETKLIPSNKKGAIVWITESESSVMSYLRQDISLLYKNGQFKRVQNKWLEKSKLLRFEQEITHPGTCLYETITFHHGEIHDKQDQITSIQKMSNDFLYTSNLDKHTQITFKIPKNETERFVQTKLNSLNKQQLQSHWSALIKHYDINDSDYLSIPLTQLVIFDNQNIPSLSQEETYRVIGQLWEGLYNNYIIPLSKLNEDESSHYIPLIMLDKNHTHLLVLFELNGKIIQLKQLL